MPRTPNPLRSTSALFNRSPSVLGQLFQQARRLVDLQKLVDTHLPASLRGRLSVASYEDDLLLLVTDNAHRAATLRYRETELIRSLKQERQFRSLKRVRFAIRPGHQPRPPAESRQPLSEQAARHIVASAKYIEDADLREALIQLAKRRSSTT